MRVFLSWSGNLSKSVATALRHWLPFVFQDIAPWMSDRDISAGGRWGAELGAELSASNFGVLCLTPNNLTSPWLLFEAGSLAKDLSAARLVPYRFGISPAEVISPLAQFQGVAADELGTLKLCEGINSVRPAPLAKEQLAVVFAKWWPDLKASLEAIERKSPDPATPRKSERELLEGLVSLVQQVHANTSPSSLVTTEDTIRRVFFVIGKLRTLSSEELERQINSAEDAWYKHDRAEAWFFAEVANAWTAAGLHKCNAP